MRYERGRLRQMVAFAIIAGMVGASAETQATLVQPCVGDCNVDAMVAIDELVAGVNAAQGRQPLDTCPAFDCEHEHRRCLGRPVQAD